MAANFPFSVDELKPIPGAKVAIIASMWHQQYLDVMIKDAQTIMQEKLDVPQAQQQLHFLPGAYELPYAAQALFENDQNLDAIIAFGIVLNGQTTHDQSVIQSVVNGFSEVMLRYKRPIINEVIGVTSLQHAEDRQNFKGKEAAFALSQTLSWRRSL